MPRRHKLSQRAMHENRGAPFLFPKTIREQEYNDRRQKLEKERQEREIQSAERRYEYLKGREDIYRKYYHDAKRDEDREFWYKKTREVDEAGSKVMRLKNQR
jgi:hypothetical protein